MFDLLRIYHHLPYPLRVVSASLHGMQLERQRYTAKTDRLVRDALDRESWSISKWQDWKENQLSETLWHAARNVPYYQDYWQSRSREGFNSSPDRLENWPILSKEVVRQQPESFLARNVKRAGQIIEHTSGTTGKPLTIWLSHEAVRNWYALFEARWRSWYDVKHDDRWGILGGQLVTPFQQLQPPFWVWNAGMRQLYLSSYHLSPPNIKAYLDAIEKHKLVYLLGYASSLYALAQLGLEQNLSFPPLKTVISNAEPLFTYQRELISRAFQCPVYDTYGLSENVCAASECLSGSLHLWPEVGVTETIKDNTDEPVDKNKSGRIICTGFLNKVMPLIRYDTGDRGWLGSKETGCGCRRSLPILGGIEGRQDDVLITKDGRRIGRLDPIFKVGMPIREAQIVQDFLDHVKVLYVPAPGCSDATLEEIEKRLSDRMGDIQIDFEKVNDIPRNANGKFRAVISRIKQSNI